MHRLALAFFAAVALLPASCSNSSSSGSAPALGGGSLGPAGGAISALGGAVYLSVPPGALSGTVQVSITESFVSIVPGYFDVGPAYLFSPAQTRFTLPVTVQIPFDARRLPATVQDDDLVIGYRDETGRVGGLRPSLVDRANGAVLVETTALGAFWVASPDIVSGGTLFPLMDGDSYRYDSGLVMTVARTSTEPNFDTREIAKVTLTQPGNVRGMYFELPTLELRMLGEFETIDSQERLDSPVTLVGERDSIGTVRPQVTTYLGFRPFGSPIVRYSGITRITSEVYDRERISTPLGDFDTVHVLVLSEFSSTRPEQGERLMEFWFAEGIGPVQMRFDDGPVQRLVEWLSVVNR